MKKNSQAKYYILIEVEDEGKKLTKDKEELVSQDKGDYSDPRGRDPYQLVLENEKSTGVNFTASTFLK